MDQCDDYVVVEFTNNIEGPTEVGTVYKNWLYLNDDGDLYTYWPPSKMLKKYLAKKEIHQAEWPSYETKILFSCNDLISAWAAEKKLENNTAVSQSDTSCKGRGKRKKKATLRGSFSPMQSESNSSEDPDSDLPPVELSPLHKKAKKFVSQATTSCSYKINKIDDSSPKGVIQKTPKSSLFTSSFNRSTTKVASIKKNSIYRPFFSSMPSTPPFNSTFEESSIRGIERSEDRSETQQLKERISNLEKIVYNTNMDVREGLEILRTLRDNAQNIDKDLLQHNENPLAEEIEESLPLKSLEELFRLEEALKDENYKKAFMAYLMKIGGTTVDNNVQRILVKTFTNEVAQLFSWEGKSGKQRLDHLAVVKVISRAVSGGPLKGVFNDKIFENRVREWFRQAKTRLNAKLKKRTPAVLQDDEENMPNIL